MNCEGVRFFIQCPVANKPDRTEGRVIKFVEATAFSDETWRVTGCNYRNYVRGEGYFCRGTKIPCNYGNKVFKYTNDEPTGDISKTTFPSGSVYEVSDEAVSWNELP